MGEMGMGVRIHPRVGCGVWMEVGEERVVGGVEERTGDRDGDADQEMDAEDGGRTGRGTWNGMMGGGEDEFGVGGRNRR